MVVRIPVCLLNEEYNANRFFCMSITIACARYNVQPGLMKGACSMICQTVKTGTDCFFMTKKGCNFNGGTCYAIVTNCEGCGRVKEYPAGKYCASYPQPEMKWKSGKCNFATHIEIEAPKEEKKVNALKASKRKAAGKM